MKCILCHVRVPRLQPLPLKGKLKAPVAFATREENLMVPFVDAES